MPDYNASVQGPNLGGLDQGTSPISRGGSSAATAQLISTLGQLGASAYGKSQAKKAGEAIGGVGENYEAAGIAADQALTELQGLSTAKAAQQGAEVTPDQKTDLRNQVFGKILTNQKRIESALARGHISSTEASARLSVLRNEALANPLVAPYQDQLDNALYRTTGGSGFTVNPNTGERMLGFGSTGDEQTAAAARKGQLAAVEETQKQVTTMIQTGIASSEKQALNYIAQTEEQRRQMSYFAAKKAELGLTSQEVFASNQVFQTQQASSAFGAISAWQANGGPANQRQSLQLGFVRDGELAKQAIRAAAFNKEGKLVIEPSELTAQIAEVDKRVKDFTGMIDDQAGTKMLTDQVAQMTAAMDLKGTTIQVDLAKRLPLLYALKDSPIIQKWYIDNVTDTNKLATNWATATNPIKRMLASYPISELNDKVSNANDSFLQGAPTDNVQKEILSDTLTARGGAAAADKAYADQPEATLKTLGDTPFTIKGITNNDEWKRKTKTPEGKDQLAAVIQGAASRALVSSVYEPERKGEYTEGVSGGRGNTTRYKTTPTISVPQSVKVVRNEQQAPTGGGRGSNVVGKRFEEWTIDTGGVRVSDLYKSELVNAYKLGTDNPDVWNDDFKTMDEWLNHLFSRPAGVK